MMLIEEFEQKKLPYDPMSAQCGDARLIRNAVITELQADLRAFADKMEGEDVQKKILHAIAQASPAILTRGEALAYTKAALAVVRKEIGG